MRNTLQFSRDSNDCLFKIRCYHNTMSALTKGFGELSLTKFLNGTSNYRDILSLTTLFSKKHVMLFYHAFHNVTTKMVNLVNYLHVHKSFIYWYHLQLLFKRIIIRVICKLIHIIFISFFSSRFIPCDYFY